ncbi:MAG: hypothetical protein ACK5MK_11465 [Dysgonomonas sp.]
MSKCTRQEKALVNPHPGQLIWKIIFQKHGTHIFMLVKEYKSEETIP